MGRSHAGGVPGRGCGTNGTGSGSNPIAVLIPALLGLLLGAFLLPGCGEGEGGGTSDSMTTSTITEVSSAEDAVQAAVPWATHEAALEEELLQTIQELIAFLEAGDIELGWEPDARSDFPSDPVELLRLMAEELSAALSANIP